MSPLPHIILAVGAATLAGAAWAGIAGFLKAAVGAHEVISTIMLNWIAIWIGEWLFGDGGPLQNPANATAPISNDIANSAKLPVFWGEQELQGLHIGFFVALLGRNTAAGVAIGGLLFGALLFGTTHGLQAGSSSIDPSLAGNLTYIIQGLIVLFVGADVLILYVWNSRKRLRPRAATT